MQSIKKRAGISILYRLLIGCIAVLACTGCSEDEPVVRMDLTKRVEVTPAQPAQAITYAYLPQYSHSVSFERH